MRLEDKFPSPEKGENKSLLDQRNIVLKHTELLEVLEASPNPVVILNKKREVVHANEELLKIMQIENVPEVMGFMLGETINCRHANEFGRGCSDTEYCSECLALKTILESNDKNKKVQNDARISLPNGEAMDLRVTSKSVVLDDQDFKIVFMENISDAKRKEQLIKIFFHDVLQPVSNISAFSELLESRDNEAKDVEEIVASIRRLSEVILNHINAQRDLMEAENDDYVIRLSTLTNLDMVKEIAKDFEAESNKKGCKIRTALTEKKSFQSDQILLRRVLSNFLKNALEESKEGDEVTIGCNVENGCLDFYVSNPDSLTEDVRLQVFQRSFSTKDSRRGLGTYSARLFVEKYLKGDVYCEEQDGQILFHAILPTKY